MIEHRPIAIVDIGSNSVRLVVYSGATRIPSVIFNEKVMAGLGRGVERDGTLSEAGQERALAGLRRFAALIPQMGVARHTTVATAAVRDASNGGPFLDRVRALGFAPEVLSGAREAEMAGQGVISGIPEADGIVGDLGGGSLELAEVKNGAVRSTASLPLGVLRLDPAAKKKDLVAGIAAAAERRGFAGAGEGRPLYLVGGSWRALARFDILLTGYPLLVTHQYAMTPDRPAELRQTLGDIEAADPGNLALVSASRVPTLPGANLLLEALVEALHPSHLVVSAFGIREGLLYEDLDDEARALDPLIEAAREAGTGLGRFAQHGDLLCRWIAPLFDDPPPLARLRRAACLLADVAWQAHPDFRAERGVEMALHGNWVGIDGPGRVMLAQALFCNFGGGRSFPDRAVAALCTAEELRRASLWGLAMRLGQRLSGGVAAGLEKSRLSLADGAVRLEIDEPALYGEPVERRFRTLAKAMGLRAEAALA